MGAAKAGLSIVTFSEKDSKDSFHHALKDSGARGIIFSPSTSVDEEGGTRQSLLQGLMPELNNMYPGDALNLAEYPSLKQIVQTDHTNMRGVIKFKDVLVYANTSMSGFSLPQNEPEASLFECYRAGTKVS